MFSTSDISEYYDTTRVHYNHWWKLGKNLSLHYGIWDEGIRSFSESLMNTNRIMMEIAGISENDKVLDAGCGVGGAAIYINRKKNAEVTGITLSRNQVDFASELVGKNNLAGKVNFRVMDFTRTSFNDESFDVVWACESVCQTADKDAFIRESHRLLKKGGRLILSDYFLTDINRPDKHSWIRKWCEKWAMADLTDCESFISCLRNRGFSEIRYFDYSDKITKSSKRMYLASLLGAIPSEFYNLFHPGVSRFARHHYRSGYYQYKALKEGLWQYIILLAVK